MRILAVAGLLVCAEAFLRSPPPPSSESRQPTVASTSAKGKGKAKKSKVPPIPSAICPNVSYIRIQKTGSTSLGEFILPVLANAHNQTAWSIDHMEYRRAKRKARDCMLTMLRDPVERLLSEFTYVRSKDIVVGKMIEQDQWDWASADLEWLHDFRVMEDSNAAFKSYLHYPRNPSRNRQTLYVLGFQRVPCEEERCCGEQCTKPEYAVGFANAFPAGEYDWDGDHDRLLAHAKRHLMSMRAFGVADCFEESMGVIAKAFGWNVSEARSIAKLFHMRQQKKWEVMNNFSRSARGASIAGPAFLLQRQRSQLSMRSFESLSRLEKVDSANLLWSSFLRDDLAEEIRRVNRLDDELVAFAKQQLYEQHGILCGQGAMQPVAQ